MCGIAGFLDLGSSTGFGSTVVRRMTDTIRHRGPDDSGYYRDPWASLGFRRLAIIDVAGGHQPMANEDGTHCIIFNGEIFNHAGPPPGARTSRPSLHHPLRHRNHPPRLRAVRPRMRTALPRHVRLCHLGQERAQRSSAPATASARSPFTTSGTAALFAFASEIKALLEHPADFARNSKNPCSPSTSPSATSATSAPCSAASAN